MVINLIFSQRGLEQCLQVRAPEDVLIALGAAVSSPGTVIRQLPCAEQVTAGEHITAAELAELLEQHPSVSWY